MAAVPQSTVRTTGAGITTYVGNFVNATTGYYMGTNQIISPTRAATFVTLDTGQGANELYDMDQNVLTTSSPTFDDVTVSDEVTIGGVTRTSWPSSGNYSYGEITIFRDGAYSVAQDNDGSIISNATDAYTVWTAAFAAVNTDGGGTIKALPGVYTIDGSSHPILNVPSSELYTIQGSGLCDSLAAPTSSGGSVLSFTNGARFGPTSTGCDLIVKDIVFSFSGTYKDAAFDFINNSWVSSYGCGYAFRGTVPTGNAGNPSSTLTGNCMNIGKISGPTGLPFTWVDNRFYDNRQGGNASNTLLCFVVEQLVFERNYFRINFQNTLTTPNLMFVNPVSGASISYNTMFTDSSWDTAGSQYQNQIMSSGANKNIRCEYNQFLDPTDLTGSHFYTNSGTTHVEGSLPHKIEGGTDPVILSVGGSGTVDISMSGRGYEVYGSDTIVNGTATTGNIAHGLLGTPTYVSFTGTTLDSSEIYASTVDGTNIVGTVDGNVAGNRTVYYYARYSIVG